MATSRPFSYNIGSTISGTEQVGDLAVGTPDVGFESSGVQWWNGPDEELGYVIAKPVPLDNQSTPVPGDNLFLSTTYKATDIVLSNNNQTATQIFSYQQSVLGQTLISDGDKVMFSVKFTSTQSTVGVGGRFIGIGLTAMGYSGPFDDGYPGGGDERSIGLSDLGELYFSTAVDMTAPQILSGDTLPTWTNGDVIDVAIDYDLSLLWLRVNGGFWNNYTGSDPSTSSAGVDISSFTVANSSAPGYYPVLCPYIYGAMEVLNIPSYGYPSGYNFLGKTTASVGFLRSSALTDTSFKELVNSRFNQNFLTAQLCKDYLTTNGYWTSWSSGGATGPGWQFYYSEGPIGSTPPHINNGDVIFFNTTAGTITYNANYPGGGVSFQILLNENQSDGSSFLSAFNTLDTFGGTIAISQGANTAIYSGGAGEYFVQNFGGSNALVINLQTAAQTQTATAPFTPGIPITVVVS